MVRIEEELKEVPEEERRQEDRLKLLEHQEGRQEVREAGQQEVREEGRQVDHEVQHQELGTKQTNNTT